MVLLVLVFLMAIVHRVGEFGAVFAKAPTIARGLLFESLWAAPEKVGHDLDVSADLGSWIAPDLKNYKALPMSTALGKLKMDVDYGIYSIGFGGQTQINVHTAAIRPSWSWWNFPVSTTQSHAETQAVREIYRQAYRHTLTVPVVHALRLDDKPL